MAGGRNDNILRRKLIFTFAVGKILAAAVALIARVVAGLRASFLHYVEIDYIMAQCGNLCPSKGNFTANSAVLTFCKTAFRTSRSDGLCIYHFRMSRRYPLLRKEHLAARCAMLAHCQAVLGAGSRVALIDHFGMAQRRDLNPFKGGFTADSAVLACCKTAFRAGGRNCFYIRNLHMAQSKNNFLRN